MRFGRDRAHRRRRSVLALVFLLGVVVGCGRDSQGSDRTASETHDDREHALVVFAATSLRDVFSSMSATFEARHPGVDVTFEFAGTQELRTQLEHGAAADVFASADLRQMDALVRAARVGEPVVFAQNEPVLVVANESAAIVRSIDDLPRVERIVVGAPEVPIGRYTLAILDRASATLGADFRSRVEARVASRELDVRQVLTKVMLGEAQAGFVYATDANAAAGRVRVVPIPPALNVVADYPIAVIAGAAHPRLARAWVGFVLSAEGRDALVRAGFRFPATSAAVP